MRYFRLSMVLVVMALVAASAALGMLIAAGGHTAAVVLSALAVVILSVRLMQMVRRLIHQMSFFVNALSDKDFMIRFPESDDRELCEMFSVMNRIIALYRDNRTEIETKRLYYDRILKIMNHELRNSITPLVSLSDDMLKRPQVYCGDVLREGVEVINDRCVSIKRFLDAYYEMTHLPPPQMGTIEVEQLLAHVRRLFVRELRRPDFQNVDLRFSVGRGMTLDGDEALLCQVLINLINNALQATAATARPLIEVVASTPGGKPCITVTDNGTGIVDDIIADIFQPFYTTRSDGTGVGLCISRQIMRQHGGDLTVSSRPGKGAQFAMVF